MEQERSREGSAPRQGAGGALPRLRSDLAAAGPERRGHLAGAQRRAHAGPPRRRSSAGPGP